MPFQYSEFRDHLPAGSSRTPPVALIEPLYGAHVKVAVTPPDVPRRRSYRLFRGRCQPALYRSFYRSLSFPNGLQGTAARCMGRWRLLCNGFISNFRMEREAAVVARRFGQTLWRRVARASTLTHGKSRGPAMPRHRRHRRRPRGGWPPTRAMRCFSGWRWRT